MEIKVYYLSNEYTINPETVSLDERLDKVLDSVGFNFMSDEIKVDLPPFTICYISGLSTLKSSGWWYISTKCTSIVEMPGYYYHSATLVDPLKRLETFIIGSSAFSFAYELNSKTDYAGAAYATFEMQAILQNKLAGLISQKYGVNITFIPSRTLDNQMRNFSFGSGTTAKDIVDEICKAYGLYAKATLKSTDENYMLIQLKPYYSFDINLMASTNITPITNIVKIEKNQDVDDYCSDVESEMNNIVDRNDSNTVILTPRSTDGVIYKDNACLVLPNDIERINNLWIYGDSVVGPAVRVPYGYYDTVLLEDKIPKYMSADTLREKLVSPYKEAVTAWLYMMGEKNDVTYADAFCKIVKGGYLYIVYTVDLNSVKSWIKLNVLEHDSWALLTSAERPRQIYYTHGSNTIDGFNNYYNSEFWASIIYGEYGPFLKELKKDVVDTIEPLFYNWDSDKKDYTYEGTALEYLESYTLIYFLNNGWDANYSIINCPFKVDYVPIVSANGIQKKTIESETEASWKKSTKSYDNGANSIDFNKLIPALKQAANMQGLETVSIESLDDSIDLGTYTQYGYVISKQSVFNLFDGEKSVQSVTYNCSNNYEQIALSIGVPTQYESTNVASNDIVNRFITVEFTQNEEQFEDLSTTDDLFYIGVAWDGHTAYIHGAASRMICDDKMYFTFSAEDNFTFARQVKTSSVDNYWLNYPVEYSDDNQESENYSMILKRVKLGNTDIDKDKLDRLPSGTISGTIVNVLKEQQNIKVFKDSRERLTFQFIITKN